ncbi:MAG: hypothetical protein AUK47_27015 [Deltaproteobacteria bacterium CG2_30_63_29]|nr:MAG: hypothetical protein AUK47_27015 [Deltaproteobacteria bacterium CG2_30_63_29]PIV98407.1 MAG: hypothetical protein COW42_14805 [Deltaproteobacteria bacterium CG17_big_fil_post_rev_8_21_14_2_50_63_7]PJB44125.1 MAG: hypothetical protein CO108_09175 [Deltaproteobacteria bacterium CG_4_9_14_3_um_filter_63_12]
MQEAESCNPDLVAEYRVIPTFCAPRSGNQKGSVENLVGFTKTGTFRETTAAYLLVANQRSETVVV